MGVLDILYETYYNVLTTLSPIGRALFLPYSTIRILTQWLHYQILNLISLVHVFILYNYNILFMINESNDDKLTFNESLAQKRHYNKYRAFDNGRPIAKSVHDQFIVVSNFQDFLYKVWFRTDYYYNRLFFHAPVCIFKAITLQDPPVYVYEPVGFSSDVTSTSASLTNANPDKMDFGSSSVLDYQLDLVGKPAPAVDPVTPPQSATHSSFGFTPKPYNLSPTKTTTFSRPKNAPSSHTPLLDLFNQQQQQQQQRQQSSEQSQPLPSTTQKEKSPLPTSHPINKSNNELTINNSKSDTARSGTGNFLYKIKIRKRSGKDQVEKDPTSGRYDLVRQSIKNCLPKPEYDDGSIGPNMVRFTWHCCAHFDKASGTGGCGGGTMRFAQEFNDDGNTGLNTAKSYLDQVHEQYPWISFADLYTLGGVVAIEAMGGPQVPWRPGRTDCPDAKKVPPMGRLPLANLGTEHIKDIFYTRLGMNAGETVALIGGGHTIGRCHAKFSGYLGPWTSRVTTFDNEFFQLLLESKWDPWVVPATGNNQYMSDDGKFMMLNTDMELLRTSEFREWVETFAKDQPLFFKYFAGAYGKLLELGVIRDEDGIQRIKM